MNAIEQAEDLRRQAIAILVKERDEIDTGLAQLGHGQEKAPLGKKRGRKPKIQAEALGLPASHSETREPAEI
jgi:hypothetical protein